MCVPGPTFTSPVSVTHRQHSVSPGYHIFVEDESYKFKVCNKEQHNNNNNIKEEYTGRNMY